MARDEGPKSKLVKLLQQVSRGASPRIGLVPVKQDDVPAMALIASLPKADPQLVTAAVAAGADAVAVPENGTAKWQELVAAAGAKPLGIAMPDDAVVTAEHFQQLIACEPDFVVAAAHNAPVTLLQASAIGKIISLDETYSPHHMRALGDMPVDAVLGQTEQPATAKGLTVRDLLHYRQVVDTVRRPVLVAADARFTPEGLATMRDMGLEGLFVLMPLAKPDEVRERIAAYRQAIGALGRPVGRAREQGPSVVVPRMISGAPEPEDEPDDE